MGVFDWIKNYSCIIRSLKSKDRQYSGQQKKDIQNITSKQKIEQHNPAKNWVNAGAPEGLAVPVICVVPIV
jgi:hypothetical protein